MSRAPGTKATERTTRSSLAKRSEEIHASSLNNLVATAGNVFADFIELLQETAKQVARRCDGFLSGIIESTELLVVYAAPMRKSIYGVYRGHRWLFSGEPISEIVINANLLSEGAELLLTTIVHEMTHAYNVQNGISDTCQQGRYHNRAFGQVAAVLGLRIAKCRYGVTTPGLSPAGEERYADLLAEINTKLLLLVRQAQLPESRQPLGPGSIEGAAAANASKFVMAGCRCVSHSGRRVLIRIARGAWRPGVISCRACDCAFVELRDC